MARFFSASHPVQGSCWHRSAGTLARQAREQTLQVLMSACDELPSSRRRRRRQASSRMRTCDHRSSGQVQVARPTSPASHSPVALLFFSGPSFVS